MGTSETKPHVEDGEEDYLQWSRPVFGLAENTHLTLTRYPGLLPMLLEH